MMYKGVGFRWAFASGVREVLASLKRKQDHPTGTTTAGMKPPEGGQQLTTDFEPALFQKKSDRLWGAFHQLVARASFRQLTSGCLTHDLPS